MLASASPARLSLLRAAGFAPEVVVSGLDEPSLDEAGLSAIELTRTLAEAKATAVADRLAGQPPSLVLGCDSLFEIDGRVRGKPGSQAAAAERSRAQRGRSGVLHTGHCLIDTGGGGRAVGVASTTPVGVS